MIEAITGQGFGLNVLTEMICGFVLPGYPGTKTASEETSLKKHYSLDELFLRYLVANMYFKTLGFNTLK